MFIQLRFFKPWFWQEEMSEQPAATYLLSTEAKLKVKQFF